MMRKILFIFLCVMSPITQAKIVELNCVFENLVGGQITHNIIIDLDRNIFKNGDELYEGHQVEITDEFVVAQKVFTGKRETTHTHRISRTSLSYAYAYVGLIRQYAEGRCEMGPRERLF